MNPVKELLAKAIEQKNEFMSDDIIRFGIELFNTAGKIDDVEKAELMGMFPIEYMGEGEQPSPTPTEVM
jgi:hypothetical protein